MEENTSSFTSIFLNVSKQFLYLPIPQLLLASHYDQHKEKGSLQEQGQ